MKKEITVRLEKIPLNSCLIKDEYYICKFHNGDIKVGRIDKAIKPSELIDELKTNKIVMKKS